MEVEGWKEVGNGEERLNLINEGLSALRQLFVHSADLFPIFGIANTGVQANANNAVGSALPL